MGGIGVIIIINNIIMVNIIFFRNGKNVSRAGE